MGEEKLARERTISKNDVYFKGITRRRMGRRTHISDRLPIKREEDRPGRRGAQRRTDRLEKEFETMLDRIHYALVKTEETG